MNNTQQTTQPVEVCSQLLLIAMRQVCRALIEDELASIIRSSKDLNEVITARVNDILKVREEDRAKADEQLVEMIVDRKIDQHVRDDQHVDLREVERQIEDGISDAIREHERDEHDESYLVTRDNIKTIVDVECRKTVEAIVRDVAEDLADDKIRDHEQDYDHDDVPNQRDFDDLESKVDDLERMVDNLDDVEESVKEAMKNYESQWDDFVASIQERVDDRMLSRAESLLSERLLVALAAASRALKDEPKQEAATVEVKVEEVAK